MDKVIVYTRPDGGVSVIYPAINDLRQGESEDQFIARIKAKDVPPDALSVAVTQKTQIPSDRIFRNAWMQASGRVQVDMPKAREIHMNRIREFRDKELARLDTEWLRNAAQKKNSEADAVEAQKKILRDLPQTFDLSIAKTPEELSALWPVNLPRV